ncbi:uncharacterized protein CCR75_006185 [Bremia lactucae]|uniref:Uncharacterized protein n=1 Tax=Bremia lactucae TaxID=4779 RepID=A0A976FGI3_BRELC|nr:hypothetical protein CCR75_006185 [Bremia lactucae]
MKNVFIPLAVALAAVPSYGQNFEQCSSDGFKAGSFNVSRSTFSTNVMCITYLGASDTMISWMADFDASAPNPNLNPTSSRAAILFEPSKKVNSIPVRIIYNDIARFEAGLRIVMTVKTGLSSSKSASAEHLVILNSNGLTPTTASFGASIANIEVNGVFFNVFKRVNEGVAQYIYVPTTIFKEEFAGDLQKLIDGLSQKLPEEHLADQFLQSVGSGVDVYSGKGFFNTKSLTIEVS